MSVTPLSDEQVTGIGEEWFTTVEPVGDGGERAHFEAAQP